MQRRSFRISEGSFLKYVDFTNSDLLNQAEYTIFSNRRIPSGGVKFTVSQRSPLLFESCAVHHETVVIPVDIPSRWEPRTNQSPTGALIAFATLGTCCSRPVPSTTKKSPDRSRIPVDIPTGWEPRTNQSPTGALIAFAALGTCCSSPVPSTIQFVLEPDSLRKRVRVRFLFTGGSAARVRRAVNKQRQGITMTVVSCLLFCAIKFALCELGRPLYMAHWGQSLRTCVHGRYART